MADDELVIKVNVGVVWAALGVAQVCVWRGGACREVGVVRLLLLPLPTCPHVEGRTGVNIE